MSNRKPLRKPDWLRVRVGQGEQFRRMQDLIKGNELHTVCEEALCPNLGECWCKGHATVMILGDECTRGCKFCNVSPSSAQGSVDCGEPRRVARLVKDAGLKEVVLTSVTRDDLPDGGAKIWAETIREVKKALPKAQLEVLVPDFKGNRRAAETVFDARPHVFGHNLETVPRLYGEVRPEADYKRSLSLLRDASQAGLITKTSIMMGLGEDRLEVINLMKDARSAGCSILFIGQYLSPSREHHPVERYVTPEEFDELRATGLEIGFNVVVSQPLVRSSYHSDEQSVFVAAHVGREDEDRVDC